MTNIDTTDVPIRVGDVDLRLQDAAVIRATLKRRLRRLTAEQHYKWDDTAVYSIVRVLDLAEPDWREGMTNVAARLHNSRLHWHDGHSLGEAPADTETERVATDVEEAGFPAVADDIRAGTPLDVVRERARQVLSENEQEALLGTGGVL